MALILGKGKVIYVPETPDPSIEEIRRTEDDKYKPITIDIIDKMFSMYCEGSTQAEIAEAVGCALPTVSRFINTGDDSRGLESFKDRRRKIYQKMFAEKDQTMVQKLHNLLGTSVDAAKLVSNRVSKRIGNAELLEDRDLYEDGNRAAFMAANARALNPNIEDASRILDAAAKVVRAVTQQSGVSVNVSQNSTQQAALLATSLGSVDIVHQHLEDLREIGSDRGMVIEELVRRINYASEEGAIETVENMGNSTSGIAVGTEGVSSEA